MPFLKLLPLLSIYLLLSCSKSNSDDPAPQSLPKELKADVVAISFNSFGKQWTSAAAIVPGTAIRIYMDRVNQGAGNAEITIESTQIVTPSTLIKPSTTTQNAIELTNTKDNLIKITFKANAKADDTKGCQKIDLKVNSSSIVGILDTDTEKWKKPDGTHDASKVDQASQTILSDVLYRSSVNSFRVYIQ